MTKTCHKCGEPAVAKHPCEPVTQDSDPDKIQAAMQAGAFRLMNNTRICPRCGSREPNRHFDDAGEHKNCPADGLDNAG